MKSWMVGFLMLVCVGTGLAGEGARRATGPEGLTNWLSSLSRRFQRVKKISVASPTSTLGVRGARQGSEATTPKLYWKGKPRPVPVPAVEVKEFGAALELATAGKTEEAATAFEAFVTQFPSSTLRADADHTLRMLKKSK